MEHKDAVRLTDRLHAEQGKGDPFAAAVRATRMPMIITDPRQHDNPIVFTNDAFLALTGYGRDEIMGRNCRFLQGVDTDQAEVAKLREAIDAETDISVELLNYRKDGTPFWNALYLSPVFGESGELQFFFASQFDVTDRKEREVQALLGKDLLATAVADRTRELEVALEQKTILLHEVDHRVKNNLQMVAAMIRNQARFAVLEETKEALHTTMVRVETLGTVHRTLYQSPDVSQIDVATFGAEIARSIVSASGRSDIQVVLDMKPMIVSATLASTLALLINELMTNALKHAFPPGTGGGTITVRTEATDDRMHLSVTDDGVGTQATKRNGDTFGRRLIASLVRQLDGMIETTNAEPGTCVSVAFSPMHGRATA